MSNNDDWYAAHMRARQQKNSNNPLDRRVTYKDPAAKEAEIQDPYIRELVAKRAQQQHYEPVPLNKEVNVDMDAISRQQAMLQQTSGINSLGDADLDRIFNRQQQHQPQHHMPQQQQPQQIVLREGYPIFRPIQQAFGNTFVLARQIGVVNQQLAMQPLLMKGMVQVYVVPQHQQQVNIQEIQRNPHLLSQLVEVHAAPMASLGPLLVQREAISSPYSTNGRQVISDARQPYNGRTILKG